MTRHRASALAERLGHEATGNLFDIVESAKAEAGEHMLSIATERFERRLTQEISGLHVSITRELHDGLAAVQREFRRELSAVRVDLLRWSFVFWIGQVAAIGGLLAALLQR